MLKRYLKELTEITNRGDAREESYYPALTDLLKEAREKLKKEDWKNSILPYSYRPFDIRYICYLPYLIDRDRLDLMKNFFEENLGICITRQLSTTDFFHAFVTNKVTDRCFISIKTRETGYIFPLYVYQTKKDNPSTKHSFSTFMLLFEPSADYLVRKSNLSQALVEHLTEEYKKTPIPEQIFFYIYAILYSNIYRTRYAEFLRIDFPRIPFAEDYKTFIKMAKFGERLVELHLLKSQELDSFSVRFQGKGNNRVEKIRYEKGKLYINNDQYFEGIPLEIWQYQIGGYQVCDKWLKDRKGRILSLDEIQTYSKIITAIQKTIAIQREIDKIYSEIEKTII